MFKGLSSLFGSTTAGPSSERDAPGAPPGPTRSRIRSPFQTGSAAATKAVDAAGGGDQLMDGDDQQEDGGDQENADAGVYNNMIDHAGSSDGEEEDGDDAIQEDDSVDEDDSPAAAIKAGKRKRRAASSSQQQNATTNPRTGNRRRSSRLSAPTVDSSDDDDDDGDDDDDEEEEEDLPPRKRTTRRASLAAPEKMEQIKVEKEQKKERRAKRRLAKSANASAGGQGKQAKRQRKRVESPVEEDDAEDDPAAAEEANDELPDPYAGTAAQTGASAAANYSVYDPNWSEAYIQLEDNHIALLENPETGKVFPRIRLEAGRGPINMGEIVKLRPSGGADSWLGVIEKIASKRDALKEVEGTRESSFIGLQLSWLYSQQDFRDLPRPHPAWSGPIKNMGPNERVKTQHMDWNHQSMILSAEPELVYVFDDSYPAAPPNWEEPSPHPLTFFSIDALEPLASSIYSWPALEHLPSQGRKPSPIVGRRKLPSYFFGVSAIAPEPEEGVEIEDEFEGKPKKAKKLPGGKDGVAGTPYVRAAFCFDALARIDHQEDEEVDQLEEETAADEVDRDGEYGGKKKKSKKGKGRASPKKPVKKKAPAKQIWPLTFSTHSISDKPYCLRNVQHFSRADNQWYDVDDLAAAEHTRPIPAADPSNPAPKPFSLALGARAFDSASAPVREVVDRLADLAADKIVRGGAYGLTGNAYLVTRAGAVHDRLLEHEGVSYQAEDLAEARSLLDDAVAFREEVKRRSLGIEEGRGLGKEWKSLGDEELPQGHEWVCPETGEAI